MIREKRTVNCWLLTKSKRKIRGEEERKKRWEEEDERRRKKERKKDERRKMRGGEERKKRWEKEDEKKNERRKKMKKGGEEEDKKRKKTRKAWKEIKATAKGNLQKPLQLPFILPIELITAFFNFQKLISSGSVSKQNYMMHTGHSCNFIDPFRCITSLSEARPFPMHYRPFLKLYKSFWSLSFQKPNAIKQKKEHPAPQLRKPIWLPLRSKLLSNAEIFISNSN